MRAYQRPGRKPCGIEGCAQPMYALAMCVMHYSRARKRGETGGAQRERAQLGAGSINDYGYRVITDHGHPLANSQGKVAVHRAVLYARLGPGVHPCHWCGKGLPWRGGSAHAINADHIDGNRLNNVPENLVASCLDCNTKRGK